MYKPFKKRYGLPVGFVDHTPSIIMPALAASKGADIVFKHIKPSNDWKGPDYGVCLNQKDWEKSHNLFEYACKANGASKNMSQEEIEDRTHQRRSLYFSIDKRKGEKISPSDLSALRPGGGFDPRKLCSIIGSTLDKNFKSGESVDLKYIK